MSLAAASLSRQPESWRAPAGCGARLSTGSGPFNPYPHPPLKRTPSEAHLAVRYIW